MKTKTKKLFYGWWIVIACLLVMIANIGFHNTASIFLRPVTEELGFTRGTFTFFRTVTTLVSAFLMPLYGKLSTKYSIKKIMLIGAVINGLASTSFAIASVAWHFYLISIISGLFINAANFMLIGILINRWFEDKKGLAIGIAFAGSGVGAAMMNPIATLIIENFDWRLGYLFAGGLSLIIVIPTILLLIKDHPSDIGLLPYKLANQDENQLVLNNKQNEDEEGLTLKEARQTSTFWLLFIALIGLAVSASAPNAHTVPFLIDIGYTPAFASAVITVCMIALTFGKIFMGYILDKLGIMVGSIIFGILTVASSGFALLALHPVAPWLHGIFLGLTATGFSLASNIFIGYYFGQKDFAAILSSITMFITFATALAPPVMGLAYDFLGEYTIAWIVLLILGFVIGFCLIVATLLHQRKQKS